MRTQIAIALTASYAAAAATQDSCSAYHVGLVVAGWECTFADDGKSVTDCTNTDGTKYASVTTDDTTGAYDIACEKADGTYFSWV